MIPILINITDAKEELAELAHRVSHHKEPIILTRRGKEVAALISMEDFNLLQQLQDQSDLSEAVESLTEARAQGAMTLNAFKESLGD